MEKLEAFVESAYEALRARRAEEAVKEVARKQQEAERDALLLAELRLFVEDCLPDELAQAVKYPVASEVHQGYPNISIEVEGCVPVLLRVRYSHTNRSFWFESEEPLCVPGLEIFQPMRDGNELFEGRTNITWGRSTGNYQRTNFMDAQTAIGHARERWLALAEAEAENKRLYDAMVMENREKLTVKVADQAVAEYVPVVEDVSPADVFNQALREYVFNLVDERLRG